MCVIATFLQNKEKITFHSPAQGTGVNCTAILNSSENDGNTCLHLAVKSGNFKVGSLFYHVEAIVEQGIGTLQLVVT